MFKFLRKISEEYQGNVESYRSEEGKSGLSDLFNLEMM